MIRGVLATHVAIFLLLFSFVSGTPVVEDTNDGFWDNIFSLNFWLDNFGFTGRVVEGIIKETLSEEVDLEEVPLEDAPDMDDEEALGEILQEEESGAENDEILGGYEEVGLVNENLEEIVENDSGEVDMGNVSEGDIVEEIENVSEGVNESLNEGVYGNVSEGDIVEEIENVSEGVNETEGLGNFSEGVNDSLNEGVYGNVSEEIYDNESLEVEEVVRAKVIVGKPVKWIAKINVSDKSKVNLDLPKSVQNVSVLVGDEIERAVQELEEYDEIASEVSNVKLLTGQVSLDIGENRGFVTRFWKWLTGFTITGEVVRENEIEKKISERGGKKKIDLGEWIRENESELAVEYYTPGPGILENETTRGKSVEVVADDELNYSEILAYVGVPNVRQVLVYWVEEGVYIDRIARDLDEDGRIDYVEWEVPHLSVQTFDIIYISKAEHLDENRTFVSDIYEEVSELDDIWSETINDSEYVRVVFEKEIDKTKDITIYPRVVSGSPGIEVYEKNGTEIIAEFENLTKGENKVYLTQLIGKQDTFDLRIIRGSIEIDYIVDPQLSIEDFEDYPSTGTTSFTKNWTNSASDDCEWQSDSGGTTSSSTGPDYDHTLGTTSGIYAYIETSTSGTGACTATGYEAWLESEILDATVWNFTLDFWYHMYGATCDLLAVDVYHDGAWETEVWSLSGQQQTSTTDSYDNAIINLGDYTGDIQLRIRGVRGTSYTGDIAIDDISINGTYRNDPPTAPTAITCNEGSDCDISVSQGLTLEASGSTDSDGDTITYFLEAALEGIYSISNSTFWDMLGQGILGTSQALLEDFESYSDSDSTISGSEWTNDAGDDCDWMTDSAGTPSSNTGPSVDHTLGSSSGEYFYMETSSGYCQNTGTEATFSSVDSYDATNNFVGVSFWYHMYGSTIGTLYFDVNDGGGWVTEWSETGAQGDTWYFQDVDLSSYTGDIQMRFRGVQAGSYYSDFAFDDINIRVISRTLAPSSDVEIIEAVYENLDKDYDSISLINVTVEVDSYNPSASVSQATSYPDLRVELWDGSSWVSIGSLGLTGVYTSDTVDSSNHFFTLTTTDSGLINVWKNASNQDIRLVATYMDFASPSVLDEINVTNLDVDISGNGWIPVGSHLESGNYYWDTSSIEYAACVDLRSLASDLFVIDSNSSYYEKNSCLTIFNTVPSTPEPILYSNDLSNASFIDLVCDSELIDMDGGSVDVTVNWYRNGLFYLTQDYSNNYANGTSFSTTLGAGNLTAGEIWKCGIVLFDGSSYSEEGNSSDLLILNTAPDTDDVVVNASLLLNLTTEDLTCYAEVSDSDIDDVFVDFVWYRNGKVFSSGRVGSFSSGSFNLVDTIDSADTARDEEWVCSVRGDDGVDSESDWNNASLVILNTLPYSPTVGIGSVGGTNETDDDLVCLTVPVDEDGDAMSVTVNWYRDGEFYSSYVYGSVASGSSFEGVLLFGNTTNGETWKCGVVLDDGDGGILEVNSSDLDIVNTPPVLGNIGNSFDGDGGWGEFWNFSADVTDINVGDVNVSLWFSSDGVSYMMENSSLVSCPCSGDEVKFLRDEAWSSSYVGTGYFEFRVDDFYGGSDSVSDSVLVLKDDVVVSLNFGDGVTIDRNGTASDTLSVDIGDLDRNGVGVEDGVGCAVWITEDGTNYGGDILGSVSGGTCSYTFDPSSNYSVGIQNWKGGTFGDVLYKDLNSSEGSLTLVGEMFAGLESPAGDSFNSSLTISFRWNLTGDASEMIDGASNSVEIISNGLTVNACSSEEINDEGNGWYNCDYVVPFDLALGAYDVRVNSTLQYYYDNSEYFSGKFDIVTNPPVLSGIGSASSGDGGWGEIWDFSVGLTEVNPENVNVSLWFSTDNVNWILQNSSELVCPCSGEEVSFDRSWNESYIGTGYYEFRANDYNSGTDYISSSAVVDKDDISVSLLTGMGGIVDRIGDLILLEVLIGDTDRGTGINDGSSCGVWVTTDGSNYGGVLSNTSLGDVCSYYFDADSVYEVGVRDWVGGIIGDSNYKDLNSSISSLTIVGDLDSKLEAPNGFQDYDATDTISFRFNLSGDASEVIGSADDLSVEIIDSSNIVSEVCDFGQINNEGGGWYNCDFVVPLPLAADTYDVRVNSSETYYNDGFDLFLDVFDVVTDVPELSNIGSSFEDDGGWGEAWNFTVDLTDSNSGNVNVSLWYSLDNVSWVLQDEQDAVCPCVSSEVEFAFDEGWNESYIGTGYYEFRVDDYHLGLDDLSDSASVLKDDVSIELTSGMSGSVDRVGDFVLLEVLIRDSDRDVEISSYENCGFWVTTDGVNYGGDLSNVSDMESCSYYFNPDETYSVGVQDWIGGLTTSSIYNAGNSSVSDLTVVGDLTTSINTPAGEEFDATDTISFRWSLDGDALEVIGDADDLSVELVGGEVREVCGFGEIVNEGGGWYNCDYVVPLDLASGTYNVRINSSEVYYNDGSDLFGGVVDILTDIPDLTNIGYAYDGDGSWGEDWNFSIELTDSNTGEVGVELYYSIDEVNWVLQNSTNTTCPCDGEVVNFANHWNGSYIGTGYFEFRTDDYHLGLDNVSAGVGVLKDDVTIEYVLGDGQDINRSQDVDFGVRIYDNDTESYVPGETVDYFVFYDGEYRNVGDGVSDLNGDTSTNWVTGCSVDVGVRDWKANYSGAFYKDVESEEFSFIMRDYLNVTLDLNKTSDVHYNEIVRASGNVFDCFGSISGATIEVGVDYPNGTSTEFVNFSTSGVSGNYVGDIVGSWVPAGTYGVNLVASAQYFYNNTNSSTFDYIDPTPSVNLVDTYLSGEVQDRFLFGEIVSVRANVTDPDGNYAGARVTLDAPSWTPVNDGEMACIVPFAGGCIYEYNLSSAFLTESGDWNVSVEGYDASGFNDFGEANFSVSQSPGLRSATITPSSAGWGETFTYNFQVREPDSDLMTVALWESSDNINWDLIVAQDYIPTSGGYFVKNFYVNSTNCVVSDIHAVGEMACNPHDSSIVGTRYWKINVTDYNRGVATTTSSSYNIEVDDVLVEYFEGDGLVLDRNLDSGILGVKVLDEDRNVYVEGGVSGRIYDDVTFYSATTNDSGNLDTQVSPDCSYSVGSHSWISGTIGNSEYEDANSSARTFDVVGWLIDSLAEPIGNSFNVSDLILLRGNLVSECGDLVSGGNIDFEVLDSSNNSYSCLGVTDEGNGYYNCDWDSSVVDEGWYNVRINSSRVDYNANSTYYQDSFFLNNQDPGAVGLAVGPQYGGWGESFDYSVNISDAEGDEVTCSLWVNTTGDWVRRKVMTSTAPYVCTLTVDDYTSADIGFYFYKFQLNDTFNEVNTSDQLGILVNGTIEEDDVRLIHLSGDNSVVSRIGTNTTNLGVRLEDLDRSLWISDEDVDFMVYYDGAWNNVNVGVTDLDGNVSYDWNPECGVEVGPHDWVGNYTGSFEYRPDESSVFSTVVIGALGISLDSPVGGILHKGDLIDLNSTVSYDCFDSGADVTWDVDLVEIANGEDASWLIPTDYSLGAHTIDVSTDLSYYDSASDEVEIEVYGWSEVEMAWPEPSGEYDRGSLVITCNVTDSFGGGIPDYPVEFLADEGSVYNGTTNGEGIFNWTWDNTLYDSGWHDISCRIRDNDSLYYNATVSESGNTVRLIAGLRGDVALTPDVPGPLIRVAGGVSSENISWDITNVRDETGTPVSGVTTEVYWRGVLVGNTLSGSYNIPNDNPIGQDDDLLSINLTKIDYEGYDWVSEDFEIKGVISDFDSVATWSPNSNSINNYIGGPEGGPNVGVSYIVNNSNGNVLNEGADYFISLIGDHDASTNGAGTSMNPGIVFSGAGDYEGEFTKSNTYWVYGYLAAIAGVDWEPTGTCIDNFAPTTVECGSTGRQPAIDYSDASLVVIDNLGAVVPKTGYSEPSGGDTNEDSSLKLGDWNPLDNVAGDSIESTILVLSALDYQGTSYWHGEVNRSKEFTVWDRSFIQPTSPVNGEDVFRSTCSSPDSVILQIYLEDDLISPNPASGATINFYTSAGNCSASDLDNGYYECDLNPEDSLTPGSYEWDAEALEFEPYHGSGNFSDSWGYQTIDVMGCLQMESVEPSNNSDFTTSDVISIRYNITDEFGNIISSASTSNDIDKHDGSHSYPSTGFNSGSGLWEGFYDILGSDPEGLWGITSSSSKEFYAPTALGRIHFKVAGILSILGITSDGQVDRGGDWGYGESILLNAEITDEGGVKEGATVYFYVNDSFVGMSTTNASGIAVLDWNPEDIMDVGTYKVNVTTHSLYSINYSGGEEFVNIYGRLLVDDVNSEDAVDRNLDLGHGLILAVNASVINDLGETMNGADVEFYVDEVGLVDSDSSGEDGWYTGNWDPLGTLAVGPYLIYAGASNVAYYHDYLDMVVNSSSDVYGILVGSLDLDVFDIYRTDSNSPSEAVLMGSVVDENGAGVSDVNFDFEVDGDFGSEVGNVIGKRNWSYNPSFDKVPGNYTAGLNVSKVYYWDGNASNWVVVRGTLNPNVALPLNYTKFYRGDSANFESDLRDENDLLILGDSYDWEVVQTSNYLGSLQNISWDIPVSHGIGDYIVRLNVSKEFYDEGEDFVYLRIFGGSVVELVAEPSIVYRGDLASYQANVRDVNGTNLIGYNCSWWVDDEFVAWALTNSSGICEYVFDPICFYNVGEHEFNVSIESESGNYYDTIIDNDNLTTAIWDRLDLTITSPEEGDSIHRTDEVTVTSSVGDYCGVPPTDVYSVNWTNEDNVSFALAQDAIFIVPASRNLGAGEIKAQASGNYYDSDLDAVGLYTYGWSRIDNISVPTSTHLKGEQININCTVTDFNTTEALAGYAIGFYKEEVLQDTVFTDASGVASWTWNTLLEEPGYFNIDCRITDNSSLYYDAVITEQSSVIEIESKINVMELYVDEYEIYRKDSEGINQVNFTLRLSDSAIGPIAGATGHVLTPEADLTCISDSDGYCTIIWNPVSTLNPNNYSIVVSGTKENYNPSNDFELYIVVRGKLDLTLNGPVDGTYHKGDILNLNWDVVDENGNSFGELPFVNWSNGYGESVAEVSSWSDNVDWQIPFDYERGYDVLDVNAERPWFDSDFEMVNLLIYGWSEVEMIEPLTGDYIYGDSRVIRCLVNDSNLTSGIEDYSVEFYYDDTLIGTNITDSSGRAIMNWNPPVLGSYSMKCAIGDDEVLYYNESIAESIVDIGVWDTRAPILREFSITPEVLETYQGLVFRANITDEINVSEVWVEIVKPDSSEVILSLDDIYEERYLVEGNYPILYGGIYNASYVPDLGGFYNVTFNANDTSGNLVQSPMVSFEAIALTDVDTLLVPGVVYVEDISQTSNSSFRMNVTCSNIGRATAYSSAMDILLPVNWISDKVFPYSCGDISSGESCFREFNITTPEKEIPGGYEVTIDCGWTNPDLSLASRSDTSIVTVTSNAILHLLESQISTTVLHDDFNTAGYTVESLGNDELDNIMANCSSGVVCSDFGVSFDLDNFSMGAGDVEGIVVRVDVPRGYAPGTYYGEILVNATGTRCYYDYCYDNLSIEVTVPTSKTWQRDLDSVEQRTVFVNRTGWHTNITIDNTGNVPLTFNFSEYDGVSDMLSHVPSATVPKQSSYVLVVDYDVPLIKNPIVHSGDFVIDAESGSIPSQLNTSMSFSVLDDVRPVVHDFRVDTPSTPGIADVDNELVSFTINVTDNIGLSNVWVCDDAGDAMEFAGGYGGCEVTTDLGDGIRQYNHTHSVVGDHSVYAFARDTSNNNLFSWTIDYRIIGQTSGMVSGEPEFIEIEDVTYFDNSSYDLEVRFDNLGEGGAYDVESFVIMPDENFVSDVSSQGCGKVEEVNVSGNCSRTFDITVLPETPAGVYDVGLMSEWVNPDGSLDNVVNTTRIKVTDKTWDVSPVLISETVFANESGEFGIVEIDNTGEIPLSLDIFESGDGVDMISYSNESLTVAAGEKSNFTIYYDIPLNQNIGNYFVDVNLTGPYFYPPERIVRLEILVDDYILPTLENINLSSLSVEANFENVTVSVDAADNVEVDSVWMVVDSADYTDLVYLEYSGEGDKYWMNYSGRFSGIHDVRIYVNDTSGNQINSSAGSFEVRGWTDGQVLDDPMSVNVVGLVYGQAYSFNVSIVLNNTGNASMRNAVLEVTPEYTGAWTTENYTYDCGIVVPFGYCEYTFVIDLPDGASPGSKDVLVEGRWMNSDLTNESRENRTDVFVESNPILQIGGNYMTGQVVHGTSEIVGNFSVDSIGNTFLTGVEYFWQNGTLLEDWLSFNPATGIQTIISAGGRILIDAIVSIPVGTDPGVYSAIINASSANGGNDVIGINASVPISMSWDREPEIINRVFPPGTTGNFDINVNNTGNINLTFGISGAGIGTSLTFIPSSFSCEKQQVCPLPVGYTISPDQDEGLYDLRISIENDSTSPSIRYTDIVMDVRDIGPIIENPAVIPNVSDVNREAVIINASITDNGYVARVWVEITMPNGTVEILDMDKDGDIYSAPYFATEIGDYGILMRAEDNKGLLSNVSLVLGSIGVTDLEITPSVLSTSFDSITYFSGDSFDSNFTIENIRYGGAYETTVGFILPDGWSSSGEIDLGYLEEGKNVTRDASITVGAATIPGTYYVRTYVNWTNPDYSVGYKEALIQVVVESNPVFDFVESSAIETIDHGTAGNFNLTMRSSGNDAIRNVNLYCVGDNCGNVSISFSPEFVGRLDAGLQTTMDVEVVVPLGSAPGDYDFVIRANSTESEGEANVDVVISVPLDISWSKDVDTLPIAKVGTDSVGDLGFVEIQNLGNVPLRLSNEVYDIDNGSLIDYVGALPEFTVGVLENYNLRVNYTAPSTGGVYNFSLRLFNSSASPTEGFVNSSLEVTEFRVDILEPLTGGIIGARYNDSIDIRVNVTYGGLPLDEGIEFESEVGGEGCSITEFGNFGNGIWDLACVLPDIKDAVAHDLTVWAYYIDVDTTSSDTEIDAISYLDISPPVLNDYQIDAVLVGGDAYFALNVTDNVEVASVVIDIIGPENYSFSGLDLIDVNGTYRSVVGNLTELEDYEVVVHMNDTSGNYANDTAWFEVYLNKIIWQGTFRDAELVSHAVDLNFYRDNTDKEDENLIKSVGVPVQGSYYFELINRSYDIEFDVFGQNFVLKDALVDRSMINPVRFDKIPTDRIAPSGVHRDVDFIMDAYAVQTILLGNNTEVAFNFSDLVFTDKDLLSVYKCPNWLFDLRYCNSTWYEIESLNTSEFDDVIYAKDTSYSGAYVIVQEEKDPAPADTSGDGDSGSSGGSSGGGSSGGGRSSSSSSAIAEFDVKTDLIEAVLEPGESKMYSVWVSNNKKDSSVASFRIEGDVWEYAQLESAEIVLEGQSTGSVNLKLFTLQTTPYGIYSGDVVITMDGVEKRIPITLLVSDEKALMDVKAEVVANTIAPNDILKFHVSLYNVGFRKQFDVHLKYTIKTVEEEIVIWKEEELALENSLSFIRSFDFRNEEINGKVEGLPVGKYLVEVVATYENRTASSVDFFTVREPFFSDLAISLMWWGLWIGLALGALGYGYWRYRKWKAGKQRYLKANLKNLPDGKIWLGKVAETEKEAKFSFDDLSTHMIVAGSTGSGKSVSAQVFVEEALKNKLSVVVFDPTAQWTGFVRPCKDDKFLKRYKQFGMKEDDARSFPGMIYEFKDPKAPIDIQKYLQPGEITTFSMAKLTVEEFDEAVANVIGTIFKQNWEESSHLKVLLIFDEVHRLLGDFGGSGMGYKMIEKAAREFRKWGIGIILCSQVLSDFKDTVKGNVSTEIQMHTKGMADIKRVSTKYGPEFAARLTKQEVGVGMLQNPKYNDGKPYFVSFRPLVHSPHKLSEADLAEYAKYGDMLMELEAKIDAMEKKGTDVTDIKLELKLAKDKLKMGRFKMAEIYIDSLKGRLGMDKKKK